MTNIDMLKERIGEQQEIYRSLKEGDASTVCYKEFQNGSWGTDDANYTNRLRLAYYLLYFQVDDEDTIVYLFQEELKDRETNSFQGIGNTLRILTKLLRKYNVQDQYAELLKRAKNANFDCACGYDPNDTVDSRFENNDLLDCLYLCEEMGYKDIMGDLLDEWKNGVSQDDPSNRRMLISFNSFLGRDAENESLYLEQLDEALTTGKIQGIVSGYRDLIQCYLRTCSYDKAYQSCKKLIGTVDFQQVKRLRLFGDILEACFEITPQYPGAAADLWPWAKAELQNGNPINRYGNLYKKGIEAARAIGDPYADELEREYLAWLKDVYLS